METIVVNLSPKVQETCAAMLPGPNRKSAEVLAKRFEISRQAIYLRRQRAEAKLGFKFPRLRAGRRARTRYFDPAILDTI